MPSDEQPPERRRGRTITERHARKGQVTPFYILVFVTAVLVLNAIFGDRGVLAMMRAQREYNEMRADLVRVQEANAQMREQARRLKEDPATIEDLARRDLGLIKPGEKVFIIRDVPKKPVPVPRTDAPK